MPSYIPNYATLSPTQKATLKMSGLVFADEKASIQLLTLKSDADAVFKLRDEDWARICGLDIRYRPAVEDSLRDYWDEFVELWDKN